VRSWQRWAAVTLGVAILVAIPNLIAALPVHGRNLSASQLLARVRASSALAYSGLVETHGTLSLPGIPNTGDIAALLSSTTRIRVWWSSPAEYRVDELAVDGEFDTAVQGGKTAQWDSTRNRAIFTVGTQPLRVPRADDLLPPALAERLTPDSLDVVISRLPAVRIAGRVALGLRLRPRDPRTTIGHVDIDVDQASGLALRVAVTGRGRPDPDVTTDFLEVTVGQPAEADVEFRPPAGALTSFTPAPDFIADVNRFAPFLLPDRLAGLPRTQRISTLDSHNGAATYGNGYTLMLLLPVRRSTGDQIMHALQPPVGQPVDLSPQPGSAVAEQIALGNVLAFTAGDRSYLLAGTVTAPVLDRAAQQLILHPPQFHDPDAEGAP
jgi:hypothetical protein